MYWNTQKENGRRRRRSEEEEEETSLVVWKSFFLSSFLSFIIFFHRKHLFSRSAYIFLTGSKGESIMSEGLNLLFLSSRNHSAQIVYTFIWKESISLLLQLSPNEFSLSSLINELDINFLIYNLLLYL